MKTLSIFLIWVLLLTGGKLQAQDMSISYPMNKAVFQRCQGNGSQASFSVAGQCLLSNQQYSLQMKITELHASSGNFKSLLQDWATFASSRPYGGLFRNNVQLPGGWYLIEIRALVVGQQYAYASVKVGVGEVYVIAGQSNAQGVTSTPIYAQSGYDGVVADTHTEDCSVNIPNFPSFNSLSPGYPVATQGPTDWTYLSLGKRIVDQTGVPVAFFNAARFATTVGNWQTSANNQPTYNVYNSSVQICNRTSQPYQPYTGFKNILNFYGSLFGTRGVLWHQGEADNQQSTSTADYQNRLNDVINKSRADFGQPSLGWYISRATYNPEMIPVRNPPVYPPVITAQNNVAASNRYGPATDNLGIPRNGILSEVHFGGSQLNDLGNAWYNSNVTTGTSVCANIMPNLQVSKNPNGTYQLIGDPFSAYVNWYWVKGDNKPVGGNIVHTGRIFGNVSSASDSYRFYAVTSAGNYVVSQKVYLPLPNGSARIGVEEVFEEEEYGYSLTVQPNPVTDQAEVRFTVPQEMHVRAELVNLQGQSVRVIADAPHASGTYTYPIKTAELPAGVYLCRVQAGDLFLVKKVVKVQR